jgi:hypothetical protein
MTIPDIPPENLATIRQLILEERMRDAVDEFRRAKPCSINFARKAVLRMAVDIITEPGNSHLFAERRD